MFENTCRIGGTVLIGYTPEHDARQFRFNITKWQAAWPDAIPEMLVARPDEDVARPVLTHVEGGEIVWTVRRYDTQIAGTGRMWVVFNGNDGEMLGETPMTTVRVAAGPPNIDGADPPQTEMPWVQQVLEAAERAEEAAKRAESAGGGSGGTYFETDETLRLENGVLGVNTATDVEQDNTLPITSAAVYAEVGNIEILLKTI